MLRFALPYVLATSAFHWLPVVPAWPWLVAWVGVAALVLARRRSAALSGLAIGLAWSHLYALQTVPPPLPGEQTVTRLTATGRIVSLVEYRAASARFLFEADRVALDGRELEGRWRLRLSWRDPPALTTGEAWTLPLRVRAVHGYATPGAWDYEGFLYWQGVRHTGYVDPDGAPQRVEAPACCALARARAELARRIDALPASSFARGVIRALVVGDRSALDARARALFSETGTSHLMAVSGLHIGLVAGIGLFGLTWAWRRLPRLCARVPARLAGGVGAMLLASVYALLAGMSLPTQRALIMLLVLIAGLLVRRETAPPRVLALAAVAVLAWHPPAVVSAGFWLSFAAVVVILAVVGREPREVRWRGAVRVQLALTLALWPVLAAFGLPAPATAPLANLVLVPLFGVFVVPLSLVGSGLLAVAPVPGAWVLGAVAMALDAVAFGLGWLRDLGPAGLAGGGAGAVALAGVLFAVLLLLAPHGMPMRLAGLPLLLLPWLPPGARIPAGDFEAHVLDVGQGLSVVVETRRHVLLFDSGPEFPTGFTAVDAVVVPFLARRGLDRLHRTVLSHGDKDHAGGVDSLLARFEVARLQSGEPARVGHGAGACRGSERWEWDGVAFEFLHPVPGARLVGNDASCVLRVANAGGSLLLTGDIGEAVERRLVRAQPERLRSDVVIAPHHGSRSSSSAPFVAATRPRHVVYTAGWANRYGFPADEVAARWHAIGATAWNTATHGAIRFRVSAVDGVLEPVAWRLAARRFWWHDAGSAARTHAVSSAD